ncbi:MAG TPA: hypothetical protein VFU04_04295, partial [Solirubrobacterales bacterium]|nr:hypothetical protein [Solirubrobacterales bacterium]
VAAAVQRFLQSRDLLGGEGREGDYGFLCTGDVDSFRGVGSRFLQMPLGQVEAIEVPLYRNS